LPWKDEDFGRFGGEGERRAMERVERRKSKTLSLNPRERKKMGNEVFWYQNQINIPFVQKYNYALASSVFNPTLILYPY
jgi:hypothetical protein